MPEGNFEARNGMNIKFQDKEKAKKSKVLLIEAEKEKTEPEKQENTKENQPNKIEQWHDEIGAIFTENEINFAKTASIENIVEEIEKLEVLLRPDPNKENKLAEPYHAALIFILDDFDRSSEKFKGRLDMNSLKDMLNIHNEKAEAFFSALFERLEEFTKKPEDGGGKKSPDEPPTPPENFIREAMRKEEREY